MIQTQSRSQLAFRELWSEDGPSEFPLDGAGPLNRTSVSHWVCAAQVELSSARIFPEDAVSQQLGASVLQSRRRTWAGTSWRPLQILAQASPSPNSVTLSHKLYNFLKINLTRKVGAIHINSSVWLHSSVCYWRREQDQCCRTEL